MEVAPFFVDFHHFLSIFTTFCRFSPFFIDFYDLRTFVAIYILSRFTHFFRKFFLAKIAFSATSHVFLHVCLHHPFFISVLVLFFIAILFFWPLACTSCSWGSTIGSLNLLGSIFRRISDRMSWYTRWHNRQKKGVFWTGPFYSVKMKRNKTPKIL